MRCCSVGSPPAPRARRSIEPIALESIASARSLARSERLQPQRGAQAVLDERPVTRRQRAWRLVGLDEDLSEHGALARIDAARQLIAAIGTGGREGVAD